MSSGVLGLNLSGAWFLMQTKELTKITWHFGSSYIQVIEVFESQLILVMQEEFIAMDRMFISVRNALCFRGIEIKGSFDNSTSIKATGSCQKNFEFVYKKEHFPPLYI